MKQNYFIANGMKHYTGTVFTTCHNGKQVDATFIYHDTDYKKFVYKIKDCIHIVGEDEFKNRIIAITERRDYTVSIPVQKQMKDFEIEGLFIGWMWYIFLMAISTILNGAIYFWILISAVFFSWRANKIKREGMYIEWKT